MSSPLRIMLVDDHALCRSGLTELLQLRGGMTVVGAVSYNAPTVAFLWYNVIGAVTVLVVGAMLSVLRPSTRAKSSP